MVRDTLVFTPLVMGLGLALLYWVVGRIVPIVIGAVAMSTVVIACVGLVAALGLPYTLVTAMIRPCCPPTRSAISCISMRR